LPPSAEELIRYVRELDEHQLRLIGRAAQDRVLTSHTSQQRAIEFEREVENAQRNERVSLANSEVGH